MFGGSFAPAGWAFCNGAIQAISQNDALFTLIGTTYGGDGQETFALPDLAGRFPMHQGGTHIIGEKAGVESVTITSNQLPIHSHVPQARSTNGNSGTPANSEWGKSTTPLYAAAPVSPAVPVNMAGAAVNLTGGSQPHENMMPFLCITFIISLFGIFPSQN